MIKSSSKNDPLINGERHSTIVERARDQSRLSGIFIGVSITFTLEVIGNFTGWW